MLCGQGLYPATRFDSGDQIWRKRYSFAGEYGRRASQVPANHAAPPKRGITKTTIRRPNLASARVRVDLTCIYVKMNGETPRQMLGL